MATERRPSARTKTATRGGKPGTATRATRVVPGARKKINPLVIGGIAGGVIVVLGIILAAALSGGRGKNEKSEEKAAPAASKSPAGPKVDERLHQNGMAKCRQGREKVQAAKSKVDQIHSLNKVDQDQLRRELEDAKRMLVEGMEDIDKSGAKDYVTDFTLALSECRRYLKDLSGK